MAALHLRFEKDEDGTGKLWARAESEGFSGEGGAWFSAEQIQAFALSLAAFPLEGRPSLAGGHWSSETPASLERELLSIACYPVNTRGYIGVHVRMASWPFARPESQHIVALEIITLHEPLGRFSREEALVELVRGTVEEAVLEGE